MDLGSSEAFFGFASIGPCRPQNVLPVFVFYNLRLELASFFQDFFQGATKKNRVEYSILLVIKDP